MWITSGRWPCFHSYGSRTSISCGLPARSLASRVATSTGVACRSIIRLQANLQSFDNAVPAPRRAREPLDEGREPLDEGQDRPAIRNGKSALSSGRTGLRSGPVRPSSGVASSLSERWLKYRFLTHLGCVGGLQSLPAPR